MDKNVKYLYMFAFKADNEHFIGSLDLLMYLTKVALISIWPSTSCSFCFNPFKFLQITKALFLKARTLYSQQELKSFTTPRVHEGEGQMSSATLHISNI